MDEKENPQSREVADRLAEIEKQLAALHKAVQGTRRTIWRTWFFSEVVSPLIAILVLVGAIYFGVTYIEDRFLGGASIFAEVQRILDSEGQ